MGLEGLVKCPRGEVATARATATRTLASVHLQSTLLDAVSSHQPPATSDQPPVTSNQPPVTNRFFLLWCLLTSSWLGAGCLSNGSFNAAEVPADWIAWQAKRHEAIAGTNGWTTLIGRYWLTDGARLFAGSASTNQAVLPRGRVPACVGSFARTGRTVRFEAAPGVVATIDGKRVQTAELHSDATNSVQTRLHIGPLLFMVIERGGRLALRIRDPEAPARVHFAGLSYFPHTPAWRIDGRFEPFGTPRTLRVPDVSGGTQEFVSPGTLVFRRAGTEHRLDVVEEAGEEDYFVIFRDGTTGKETYGGGRFLYVSRPGPDQRVVIDFNRSYTPPCGFTAFATCPLPPRQNWLPFEVRAGELQPKKQAH